MFNDLPIGYGDESPGPLEIFSGMAQALADASGYRILPARSRCSGALRVGLSSRGPSLAWAGIPGGGLPLEPSAARTGRPPSVPAGRRTLGYSGNFFVKGELWGNHRPKSTALREFLTRLR